MLITHRSVSALLIDAPRKLILFDKLNHRAKLLLILIALYSLSSGLSSLFVTLFLFKINNSFFPPIFFYMGNYLGLIVGFVVGGLMIKKISINLLLSSGLIIESLFFGALVVLGNSSGQGSLALGLGIFYGLGEGFIWLARHLLEYESTFEGNRNRFFSSAYILATLSTIVAPLIAGFFIVAGETDHYSGYVVVFILAALLLMTAGVVAFSLKHEIGLEFKLSKLFHLDRDNKDWRSIESTQFIHGLRDGTLPILVTLATYFILKNELNVGGAASLGSAVALIIGYSIGKYSKASQRIKMGWFGVVFIVMAYVILFLGFNTTSLIIYLLLVSIAGPALYLVYDIFPISSIDSDPRGQERRATYIINAEIYWDIGRILGLFLLIILLHFFDQISVIKYFLLISTLIICPLIMHIYSHYNSFAKKV
jgi:MFS transporter, YQGE family, putative transporter